MWGGAVVKPVLTREQLDGIVKCTRPGCDCGVDKATTINLGSRCHPGLGLTAQFVRATGELDLACICGQLIATIAVAGELPIGKGN